MPVTVITGPPCAGKTTHAQQHARPGDIVLDYDTLAQALGSTTTHDHPSAITYTTRAAWQAALRAALGCAKRGARVWIIDTTPTTHRRHQYAKAGAEWITLTPDRTTLHTRAEARPDPDQTKAAIDAWLATHQPIPDPTPAGGLRAW